MKFTGFVPPLLPTLVAEPPQGNQWQHEIKLTATGRWWPSARIAAGHIAPQVLRAIQRRSSHAWTWSSAECNFQYNIFNHGLRARLIPPATGGTGWRVRVPQSYL